MKQSEQEWPRGSNFRTRVRRPEGVDEIVRTIGGIQSGEAQGAKPAHYHAKNFISNTLHSFLLSHKHKNAVDVITQDSSQTSCVCLVLSFGKLCFG